MSKAFSLQFLFGLFPIYILGNRELSTEKNHCGEVIQSPLLTEYEIILPKSLNREQTYIRFNLI